MTSNHLEQLDPALIRPGRIDKKLMLGYMGAQDVVVDMPQHYFQVTLTDPQALDVVRGSPTDGSQQLRCVAQVEQLRAECGEIEDMIAVLEAEGGCNLSKIPFGLSPTPLSGRYNVQA